MKQSIKDDLWSKRIEIIRQEKQKILNELGFFPQIEKILNELGFFPQIEKILNKNKNIINK